MAMLFHSSNTAICSSCQSHQAPPSLLHCPLNFSACCKRLFWTTVPCSFSCPVPMHPLTLDIISRHLLQDAFTNLPELAGESLLPSHSTLAFVVTQHTQLKSPVHETISGTKYGFQNLAGAQKCLWSEQMNEWGNEWMKGCVRKPFWMQKWKLRHSKR